MAMIDFVYYFILLISMLVLFRLLIKAFALTPIQRTPPPLRRNQVISGDRQGNIFTIANETTNNQLPNRCTDFYYVEPSATDAARIQAQLEKDEKDLPTYEEVMAMSLAEVNGSTLALPPTTTTSSTSVATTDTVVPVPPYSEAERNVLPTVHQPSNSGLTTTTTGSTWAASTSRAAAAAATNTPVVTIANSVSNTSV
ncbi:uncharacterized protein LOC101451491 isoform X8 [Ceratitis capitata]|uniref:Uncharacterized protein n=1 Tax=Ceratitis capitata TaxID=7213 RepID=W8B652_CERCA|nr:uncharacterized protein LOC101451491 isoform X8 [Ceratitis capitata]